MDFDSDGNIIGAIPADTLEMRHFASSAPVQLITGESTVTSNSSNSQKRGKMKQCKKCKSSKFLWDSEICDFCNDEER
jgi:hypothetical protein